MARARSDRPYLMEALAMVNLKKGLVARWKPVVVVANTQKGLTG